MYAVTAIDQPPEWAIDAGAEYLENSTVPDFAGIRERGDELRISWVVWDTPDDSEGATPDPDDVDVADVKSFTASKEEFRSNSG